MQQILWGVVKETLKGKFVALNDYMRLKIFKISENRVTSANMPEMVAPSFPPQKH